MKVMQSLFLGLALLAPCAAAYGQLQSYADFSTIDEENNIQIFKAVSPSVVNITNSRLVRSFYSFNPQEVPQGSGTGFLWDDSGYIVTNYHVVQQANRVEVTLQDGTTYNASFVGAEPDKDLAVIKIEAPGENLVPIRLGDSSLLEVGRKVIAIGNPFGLDTTMTVGIVSALGREIDSVGRRKIRDVIQTDAAINPGNSGGPLLNSLGQLVGVNTAIYSPSGASAGIGFAIPANTVRKVVTELILYGHVQTPVLSGITLIPQADYYGRMWGVDGIVVLDVAEDSTPARLGMRGLTRSRRGILLGDIITEIDGVVIENEDDLITVLESKSVGDVVKVVSHRDEQVLSYNVELQAPTAR